eukprot:scaffold148959_cov50-Cyclotella_meneghiniana.AAC.1
MKIACLPIESRPLKRSLAFLSRDFSTTIYTTNSGGRKAGRRAGPAWLRAARRLRRGAMRAMRSDCAVTSRTDFFHCLLLSMNVSAYQ